MNRNKPSIKDYISLVLAFLAKLGRKHYEGVQNPECGREYYDQFFQSKDICGANQDERRKIRNETIRVFLDNLGFKGGNILDVGCGFGEVLFSLFTDGQKSGVDISASNVAHASNLLGNKAIIKQGSIENIPFGSDSQDVCLCLEVLEHIEDDKKGIMEIWRVLKPGGLLITSVPYSFYWPRYLKLIGHYRHYKRESFVNLLEKGKFKIIEYLPNYPNWHLKYSRIYVMVRVLSLTFGWFTGSRNVFEFSWPWSTEPIITRMSKKIHKLFEQDKVINYAQSDFGTFIVAKKIL